MIFDNLTILTCSYNSKIHIETLLQSFAKVHGDGCYNLIVMDNSTNDETSVFLDNNNIKYIKNPGGTHSKSIDRLLHECTTKYALLVDTDVMFIQPINKLMEIMQTNDGTIMGEICGDRGGFKLHCRIHPWFCLINVDNIKKHNIMWHDQKRIDSTNSGYFYNTIPIHPIKNNTIPYYDNGCTFFEDINNAKLKIIDTGKSLTKYFRHYEGHSWHRTSGNSGFEMIGVKMHKVFLHDRELFKDTNIKDKFKFPNQILLIQPIFCVNDSTFKQNQKSIKSIIEYMNKYPCTNVKIILGGYCKEDKYWNELRDNINTNIIMERFDKNYGKAYVVNSLFKKYYTNQEYLFTMDSDIIFDLNEKDIIPRLVKYARIVPEQFQNCTLGMIALNQRENDCHDWKNINNSINIDNETFCWTTLFGGIAGGCLFIKASSFIKVGLYRILGVYGGEDGFLLNDQIRNGFLCIVAKTISIIHPFPEVVDEVYNSWKRNVLSKNRNNDGKLLTQQEYESEIIRTEQMWDR